MCTFNFKFMFRSGVQRLFRGGREEDPRVVRGESDNDRRISRRGGDNVRVVIVKVKNMGRSGLVSLVVNPEIDSLAPHFEREVRV